MAALPLFQLVQMFDELDYAVAITLSAHVMETLAVVNYNCLCVICNSKALCWLYAVQNRANTFCTGIVTQLLLSLFHLLSFFLIKSVRSVQTGPIDYQRNISGPQSELQKHG